MAINFTDLFTVTGKYVKSLNTLFGFLTQITTGLSDIEEELELKTLNRLTVQLHPVFERMKRDVEIWTDDIIGELRSTVITDRAFVRDKLVLQNLDFDSVMEEIINEMKNTSVDVFKTLGSLNDSFVTGKTTIEGRTTIKLDGVSPPGKRYPALKHNLDSTSELLPDAFTYKFQCISVSQQGEGTYSWSAFHPETEPYRDQAEAPGISNLFQTSNNTNLLTQTEFEDFVNNDPTGWTVTGGTVGTDYAEYNSTFRGSKAFVIKDQDITIVQDIKGLTPGRGYTASIRTSGNDLLSDHTNLKVGAQTDSLTISVDGFTKNGVAWGENDATLTNDPDGKLWNVVELFFSVPLDANPETTIIKFVMEPFTGDWMIVDEALISPTNYYTGFGLQVFRGIETEIPLVNDSGGTQTVTNSNDGVFQTFFRRAFGYLLPTADPSSISDGLAL